MRKRVLIIGAGGFIGSSLVRNFSREWEVVGVSRFGHAKEDSFGSNVTLIQQALPSAGFSHTLQDFSPQLVINAAGSADVAASMKNPLTDFEACVDLTAYLLEQTRLHCPEATFVLLSSASVYGEPATLPVSEDHPLRPISAYGHHKRIAELLVHEYEELFNLRGIILRIFSAYGPGMRRQVMFDMCRKFMADGATSIELFGTGEESRDFIHVDDLFSALSTIVLKRVTGTFNIASGEEIRIKNLAELIRAGLGSPRAITFAGQNRKGYPVRWRADVSRLRELGFQPKVGMEAGVQKFCAWFKEAHGSIMEVS